MSSAHQSHACCSVPPVTDSDYKAKGEDHLTLLPPGEEKKVRYYVTGPKDAKKAILFLQDIFGFFPQTLQGADILAYGDKENQYRVFMPDFFDGEPVAVSDYPPDTEEKKKKVQDFFGGRGAPPRAVERHGKIIDEFQKIEGKTYETWGAVGFCWGGKVVNLTSQSGTRFTAVAGVHPALVDENDAPKITIPIALLPSKDEDKSAVEKWQKGLKVKNVVEWFPDQNHGFMAARGDLKDKRVAEEYQRGYKLLLDWFHDNLVSREE